MKIVANLNCILGLAPSEANRIVPLCWRVARFSLWGVCLRELRNNRKIQIVPLESVRGRLREFVNREFVWEFKQGFVKAAEVELSAYESVRSESLDCISNYDKKIPNRI